MKEKEERNEMAEVSEQLLENVVGGRGNYSTSFYDKPCPVCDVTGQIMFTVSADRDPRKVLQCWACGTFFDNDMNIVK